MLKMTYFVFLHFLNILNIEFIDLAFISYCHILK